MKGKKGLADFILEENVLSYSKRLTADEIAPIVNRDVSAVRSALRTLTDAGLIREQKQATSTKSEYWITKLHWINQTKISNQEARILGAGNWG